MTKACAVKSLSLGALMLCPALAFAQTQPGGATGDATGTAGGEAGASGSAQFGGSGAPPSQLPPPQSDNDPRPTPPAPASDGQGPGITEQAGVGGTQAFARAGVLELGGSAGLTLGSNYFDLNLSPTAGWFIVDNFQLSGLVGLHYQTIGKEETFSVGTGSITIPAEKRMMLTALIEPSFHLPFTNTLFGFVGVGGGLAAVKSRSSDDTNLGFALQPRVGMKIMVGRSGILTPDLRLLWSTTDVVTTRDPAGDGTSITAVGIQTTFGLNVGYSVMW